MRLADLEPEFAAVPGTVSVWCAPLGAGPWYARAEHVPHYAASTMKVAVLLAAQHAHEAGTLDLDRPVPVTDRFASAAPGAPDYVLAHAPDDDPAPWERLGGTASLRWLAERMIVRSSNLATNIVLAHVGIGSAHREWARAGARHSRLGRGIEDAAARAAGITNEVTAADLGALLAAATRADRWVMATLAATEHRDDLAAGLPPGTRIAHKSGWVTGVRHGAGVIELAGGCRYLLVVCTTTALPDGAARRLLARVAAVSVEQARA
jgi:beta-lactamase class A